MAKSLENEAVRGEIMSCVKIYVVWVENLPQEVKIGFVDCVETP